jgi:hypothetical protein
MPSTSNLLQYCKKVFDFNKFLDEFSSKEKFKQIACSSIIFEIFSNFATGLHSLTHLSIF